MPLTGVFALAINPGQTSPSDAVISHISRSFPAELLPAFYLEHRLFVDTSSLIPNSNAALRKTTSILTLSHTPATTYVATVSPKDTSQGAEESSPTSISITIPSANADSFTQLISTKLQPLWTIRQTMIVENGTALSLNGGEWIVRIGDLKIPPRLNQAGSSVRGILVEVSHMVDEKDNEDKGPDDGQKVSKDDETLIRAFLESVTEGSGVPSILTTDTARSLIRCTKFEEKDKGAPHSPPDFALASLYLDILRGSRG